MFLFYIYENIKYMMYTTLGVLNRGPKIRLNEHWNTFTEN